MVPQRRQTTPDRKTCVNVTDQVSVTATVEQARDLRSDDDAFALPAVLEKEFHLAVWEFDTSLWAAADYGVDGVTPLRLIRVPYARNPHVRGQRGVFTLAHGDFSDPKGHVDRRPFDEVVATYLQPPEGAPVLTCCHTEPVEAFKVLRLLEGHGLHAGSIFPSLRVAADRVPEKLWWGRATD